MSGLTICEYYNNGHCLKYDEDCFNQCVQKQVSEEDELKFYYVDSIDAYWIGQRLDNCYYAEWIDGLGFVWSKSRYLPWGEHVIAPDTLWKEHTYPSEPREIPFTEWIVGFMKKHTSEDAISREWLIKQWDKMSVRGRTEFDQEIMVAPSVIPQQKEGEWIYGEHDVAMCDGYRCDRCGFFVPWDYEHKLIDFIKDYNFCPNCGARMKGADDE